MIRLLLRPNIMQWPHRLVRWSGDTVCHFRWNLNANKVFPWQFPDIPDASAKPPQHCGKSLWPVFERFFQVLLIPSSGFSCCIAIFCTISGVMETLLKWGFIPVAFRRLQQKVSRSSRSNFPTQRVQVQMRLALKFRWIEVHFGHSFPPSEFVHPPDQHQGSYRGASVPRWRERPEPCEKRQHGYQRKLTFPQSPARFAYLPFFTRLIWEALGTSVRVQWGTHTL